MKIGNKTDNSNKGPIANTRRSWVSRTGSKPVQVKPKITNIKIKNHEFHPLLGRDPFKMLRNQKKEKKNLQVHIISIACPSASTRS